MRTFLASVIMLCLFAGLYLLQGPAFFMPSRQDPAFGIMLEGRSAQLLGAGLLTVAALGLMVTWQAGSGKGRIAPRIWQICFFVLTVMALGLISGAFLSGTPGSDRHADTAVRDGDAARAR